MRALILDDGMGLDLVFATYCEDLYKLLNCSVAQIAYLYNGDCCTNTSYYAKT